MCSDSLRRSKQVKLRLGTRGSKLALAQANMVSDLIRAHHAELEVEIVVIKTSGDRGDRDRLGAFVREIQEALLKKEIDVALHCLKDLPTTPVEGLCLAAYLEREDVRDTLISRGPNLNKLRKGSVVGTGSLRRTSQIARLRPDVSFKPLVGNVDTRLRKLMDGEYDAIVLAVAGLNRLGLSGDTWSESEYKDLVVWPQPVTAIVPAPGQAVLVLETRSEDSSTQSKIAHLHDENTAAASKAERAFLATFGGGCSVPVGAYARVTEDGLQLEGCVSSPDGTKQILGGEFGEVDSPEELGVHLAEAFGAQGAFDIVNEVLRERDSTPTQS